MTSQGNLVRHATVRVIVVGRLGEAEARLVDAPLTQLPAGVIVERIQESGAQCAESAAAADLYIVLQSWPDEFPDAFVAGVVAGCLTGRLICCQGAWCASAGRTRSVWPQAVCVPIDQFAGRLQLELAILAGARAPLPFTAARDEVFAAVYAPNATVAARVTVDSSDTIYARELKAALDRPVSMECNALLLDVDPLAPTAARHQIEQRRAQTSAPIIAITGFPRADECADLLSAGAVAVVSRLSPLTDLQSEITGTRREDRS